MSLKTEQQKLPKTKNKKKRQKKKQQQQNIQELWNSYMCHGAIRRKEGKEQEKYLTQL